MNKYKTRVYMYGVQKLTFLISHFDTMRAKYSNILVKDNDKEDEN